MARLLIPTRNRPASLRCVLRFLSAFYPAAQVVIADGSTPQHAARNADTVSALSARLALDYRRYPADLPLFERIIDCLAAIDDEVLIMGADDDYPLFDVLERAEAHLRSDPACAVAMGGLMKFQWREDGQLLCHVSPGRPVIGGTPLVRMRRYAVWPFPTTYAVARTSLLRSRYDRAAKLFCERIFDYTIGQHDLARGAVHVEPDIGFVLTNNPAHSHLRDEDPLAMLRRPHEYLAVAEATADDIERLGGLDAAEAQGAAANLLQQRMIAVLGQRPEMAADFAETPWFQDPVVQQQIAAAHQFATQADGLRGEQFRFIVAAEREVMASADNDGEFRAFATVDEQLRSPLTPGRALSFLPKLKRTDPTFLERLGLAFEVDVNLAPTAG